MVKGVNKTIIEINETGNVMFDRVLLFVNPCKASSDSAKLKKEALDYIKSLSPDLNIRLLRNRINRKKKIKRIIIGAVATLLLTSIISIFVLNFL